MVVTPKPGAELKGSVLPEATTLGMKRLPSQPFFYTHQRKARLAKHVPPWTRP